MNDYTLFKDEVLKNNKIFEENLEKSIFKKFSELNLNFKNSQDYLNRLLSQNNKLLDSLTDYNIKIDKIPILEQFKNKVDSMIITHEIRINNALDEIASIKLKYDKAIINNLLVPGFIGPSCQFKNMGEYIMNNINELSKIKAEREMIKSSFKDLRIKTDSSVKTILNLTESLVRRSNDYTDSRISELKEFINEKIVMINEKEKEIKAIIKDFEEEQENNRKKEEKFEKDLKEDALLTINNKVNELKKNQEEIIYKAMTQNNNFLEKYINQIFENKLKNITDNIKNIENKINEIKTDKSKYLIKKMIQKKNKIKNNNNLPLVSSLSQQLFTVDATVGTEGQINTNIYNNDFSENESYSQSQTYSMHRGNNMLNNNELNFQSNYSQNRRRISHPKITSKFYQKELTNNYDEMKKNNNENPSEIIKNSKVLIFDYEQKNYNNNLNQNKKLNLSNSKLNNLLNIKTLKTDKTTNNMDGVEINGDGGEEKSLLNLINRLKTPKILQRRILSNDEIKKNEDKSNHNMKRDFNQLKKSGSDLDDLLAKYAKSFSYKQKVKDLKILENWKKFSKKWKSEKRYNLNKDRVGYNWVKLELDPKKNITNGASIIASRKLMNRHIAKLDIPLNFQSLYNVQVK